jgi:hypothetical protein
LSREKCKRKVNKSSAGGLTIGALFGIVLLFKDPTGEKAGIMTHEYVEAIKAVLNAMESGKYNNKLLAKAIEGMAKELSEKLA